MLIDPEGKEYTYTVRFGFETTNNEAEYEALLVRFQISQEMEIISLAIFVDSELLVNQIKGTYAAKQPTIKEYLQKTKEALKGFDSYTIEYIRRNQNKKANTLSKLASMIFEHLTKEVLVEVLSKRLIEEKEILQIRVKAPQYKLIRGNLYRRSFYAPWLRCVASPQTDDIVKEVHEGSCGFNAEPRSMVVRITKQGYYWPSMHRDAAKRLQDCERCKEQSAIRKVAESAYGNNEPHRKAITRSKKGWVNDLAQVLWVHRTLLRNSQKETLFSLTYGSKAIIPISETNVTKDDRGRLKEVDKRRGSKEIASIEEAYYQASSAGTIVKGVVTPFTMLETSSYFRKTTQETRKYHGPHMVSEVQGRELYKIVDASNHSLTQTTKGTSFYKFYM
ncbi:reverse transcriptase domain-containing protein [Tanacetum coccineum]